MEAPLQREADAQDGHHRRQREDGDDVAAVCLVVVAAAIPQLLLDVEGLELEHSATLSVIGRTARLPPR